MELKIKKLDDRGIIPSYATDGSAGFDLHVIDKVTIPAGGTVCLRTGLAFEIPQGYEVQIRPRSGLSLKSKLRIANAPGTIDSDYTKEIGIIVDNISQNQAASYTVEAGDRIAQAVLVPVVQAKIVEVGEIEETERGGFGSTGV